ncbi:Hsp70 family protein [Streptomyces sp. NRRL F-5193]|uniref:Hsp70 family protein n=1 Tax=Streptomyces sp. NRRL F-5193 TaxID=1463860 RepID=UPI0005BC5564|nr:Hsp70 family protein [Streptomyces sp. NRRL F-5193]
MLVADIGSAYARGALVTGDGVTVLREPSSGSRLWPSAVALDADGGGLLAGTPALHRRRLDPEAYRHDFHRDLGRTHPLWIGGREFPGRSCVAALLAALRAEAERLAGTGVHSVVLACPGHYLSGASDPRRNALRRAAREAGLTQTSLVPSPVAAALAPLDGPPFGPGDTVLVYDLGGGTFDTALVHFHPGGEVGLKGYAMTLDFHGGADVDALIAADVRAGLPDGLLDSFSGAGAAGAPQGGADTGDANAAGTGVAEAVVAAQVGQFLAEFARGIKHRLSSAEEASDVLLPGAPPYTLSREGLAEMTAELLAATVACARRLLEADGTAPEDLAGVLATGGLSRLPFVTDRLATAFGTPPRRSRDAQLAVVTGAAVWRGRGARRLRPAVPGADRTPLAWPLPPGGARLERWLTVPGARFRPGQPLALLRDADGAQWRLEAPAFSSGLVLGLHAKPGQLVTADEWPVTVGPAPVPVPQVRTTHPADPSKAPAGTAAAGPSSEPTAPPRVLQRREHGDRVQWIAFRPGGFELATAGGVTGVRVHGLRMGPPVRRDIVTGGEAVSVAYRADGRLLCGTVPGPAGGAAVTVGLYDTGSGELMRAFNRPEGARQAVFSPDGLIVAASGGKGPVRLYQAETGALLQGFPHPGMVRGLVFTPDGQTLATACADGTVRLHDLVPGRTRHLVAGGEARWLAVSPDGRWLAAAARHEHPGGRVTCPVMVYRPDTGELVAKIVHTAAVDCLAFSADSSLLATGSGDRRVRVHSTGDWVRRHELPHDHPVWALAFSPDDASLLATGTDTGAVTLWSLPDG